MTHNSSSNRFVAIRSRYYKKKEALAVLDHANALRNGFTRSINVNPQYTHNNSGVYLKGSSNPVQALELMYARYKLTTGKRPRSDFNCLFEHIVIFSEEQFNYLVHKYGFDKARASLLNKLKRYAQSVKCEFGFEPMSIDLHMDEGHFDKESGEFIRNVHAHVQFFNYDFTKKVAPLRKLMNKGKNNKGRTNTLNPNFEKMQDLAAETFSSVGFQRGISKNYTRAEHLEKTDYLLAKQHAINVDVQKAAKKFRKLKTNINLNVEKQLKLTGEVSELEHYITVLMSNIKKLRKLSLEMQKAIKCQSLSAIQKLKFASMQFSNENKYPPPKL